MLQRASQLSGGAAHREFDSVRMIRHDRGLTTFEARLHDAFGVARGVLAAVLVRDVHLDARDSPRESGERVLDPFTDALLQAFGPMNMMIGADFDVHTEKATRGERFVQGLAARPRGFVGVEDLDQALIH